MRTILHYSVIYNSALLPPPPFVSLLEFFVRLNLLYSDPGPGTELLNHLIIVSVQKY